MRLIFFCARYWWTEIREICYTQTVSFSFVAGLQEQFNADLDIELLPRPTVDKIIDGSGIDYIKLNSVTAGKQTIRQSGTMFLPLVHSHRLGSTILGPVTIRVTSVQLMATLIIAILTTDTSLYRLVTGTFCRLGNEPKYKKVARAMVPEKSTTAVIFSPIVCG